MKQKMNSKQIYQKLNHEKKKGYMSALITFPLILLLSMENSKVESVEVAQLPQV